jgi:hypothetical protein
MATVLQACTSLENLNLCKNMFRAAGAASLAHVLPQCTAITNLDLSGSYITYYNYYQHILFIFSTSFFFAPVPSHTCYPSALYSRTSNIFLFFSTSFFSLAHVLPQCTVLTNLDLSGHHIGDTGAKTKLH